MAQYPNTLATTGWIPDNRADSTSAPTNHAQDHNRLADEVIAIEAELGLTPKSGFSDVDARLDALTMARSGLSHGINHALAIAANAKTSILLAQSVPWETLVLSQQATLMISQRLTLQAVWLSAGDIATGGRMYVTVAGVGVVTAFNTSLWTYNGTTWTCARVAADYTIATGFKTNAWGGGSYTVPTSGIYYVGSLSNIASTQATVVGGDAGSVVSGDFFTDGTQAGTPTGWPRQTVFAATTTVTQGDTKTGGSPAFRQFPWTAIMGTQQ